MTRVKLADLLEGHEHANFGEAGSAVAFVDLQTGEVLCWSEELGDDLPEDLHESPRHLPIPDRHDLDLGTRLALRFGREVEPELHQEVERCFRRAGAWRRFRALLEDRGALERWHAFQDAETETALRHWAEARGLEVV